MGETEIAYVDNPQAPELYAAEACGFYLNAGNVHITFTSPKGNYDPKSNSLHTAVVARLVLPLSGAQGLAVGLYDFLKSRGVDPVPIPDASSTH